MIWYLLFIVIDSLECSLRTNSFVTFVMFYYGVLIIVKKGLEFVIILARYM